MPRRPKTRKPWWRRVLRAFLGLLLLVVVLLFGLYQFGIPGVWLQPLLNRVVPDKLGVEMKRLIWQPGEGLACEALELYSWKDRVTPWFTADSLLIQCKLPEWIQQGELYLDLHLENGRVETELGMWVDDLKTHQPFLIENGAGTVRVSPGRVELLDGEGFFAGHQLEVKGSLPLKKSLTPSVEPVPLEEVIQRIAVTMAPIVGFLEEFRFEQAPVVRVKLEEQVTDEVPVRVSLDMSYEGEALHKGFPFQALQFHASVERGLMQLRELHVQAQEGEFLAQGQVDLREQQLDLRLFNTLPRYGLEALSPIPLSGLLERLSLRVEGDLEFDFQMGPSPIQDPAKLLTGKVTGKEAFYKDTRFSEASLTLHLEDKVLRLSDMDAKIGSKGREGHIQGELMVAPKTGALQLELKGSAYPESVMSLVGPSIESILRDVDFPKAAPQIALKLELPERGVLPDLELDVQGTDVWVRGFYLSSVDMDLLMAPEFLRIRHLEARQGDKQLLGSLEQRRDTQELHLDIRNQLHLKDLLSILFPSLATRWSVFRLQGITEGRIQGVVDLSGQGAHLLQGELLLEDLIWKWLGFDQLSGKFNLENDYLQVTEIQGGFEQGSLEGEVELEDFLKPDGRFFLDLVLENVDLFKVITGATDTEDTPYSGSLTQKVTLSGLILNSEEAPRNASLNGEGSVEIRDGTLFRIPLLLGLSSILSKVMKGFGYAAQTDFSADFNIRDGVIRSENLFLKGNLVSIVGDGRYKIGDTFSVTIRVQLLNGGVLSDALNVLLWPIRKLIEIKLTGTLDNPQWEPKNLPKELFGK